MTKWKVGVDQEKCIGCGACIALAPELFEFDSSGKSKEKEPFVESDELGKKAEEAKKACPVNAIIVEKIEE